MKWLRLFSIAVLSMIGFCAQAATFSCSLGTPPGYTQTYSPTANSSTLLSITVTCVKSGGGGGLTINYTVTPSNGLYASGTQNRAQAIGYINYDLYSDSACTIPWSGSGSIAFGGGGGTTLSQMLNYYGCVPASQPSLPAPGSFVDTVSMTLAIPDPTVTITGANPRTFAVAVTVNAACTISTLPGTVDFGTYTAFQTSAKTASAPFGIKCTNTTPYTLSLSPNAAGVVSGLSYSLLLNTSPSGGLHPLASTGNGSPQPYFINGTMPANQPGDCPTASCVGTNIHTLTVTY